VKNSSLIPNIGFRANEIRFNYGFTICYSNLSKSEGPSPPNKKMGRAISFKFASNLYDEDRVRPSLFLSLRKEIPPQTRFSAAPVSFISHLVHISSKILSNAPHQQSSCPTAAKMSVFPKGKRLYTPVHHVGSTRKDVIRLSHHVQHVYDSNGLANMGSELPPLCQRNTKLSNRDCHLWKMR